MLGVSQTDGRTELLHRTVSISRNAVRNQFMSLADITIDAVFGDLLNPAAVLVKGEA